MSRERLGIAVLLAQAAVSGCTSTPAVPPEAAARFPPDVDGYHCSRAEAAAGWLVSVAGSPDYRGGLSSLTMSSKTSTSTLENRTPEILMLWTRGREAISPLGSLAVTQSVRHLPPLHTKIRLTLSSGEMIEQDFIPRRHWRNAKRTSELWAGFAAPVHTQSPDFIARFVAANWAEIDVVDPQGVVHAHERIDLSALADSLVVMRRLGTEVEADAADYERRCSPLHIEIDFVAAPMRQAGADDDAV